MANIALGLMRLGFFAGGAVAPVMTGKRAFRLFCSPPRRKDRSGPEARALMAQAEHTHVTVQGDNLSVWSFRPPERTLGDAPPERGRILLAHAWGATATSLHGFVPPLLGRGFHVTAFDLPAHGGSAKRHTTLPDTGRAVLAVIDAVGPIYGILGHSYGGLLAAFAAAGAPPLPRGVAIERLVTISAPNRFADLTRRFADILKLPDKVAAVVDRRVAEVTEQPIDDVRTTKWIAELDIPTLVIHDRDDREIPFADGEAAAGAAKSTQFKATDGLGHWRILADPGVIHAVAEFFDS